MTDKQLRSLDKMQLLDILRQQEIEIEGLVAEKEASLAIRKKLASEKAAMAKIWEETTREKEEMAKNFEERMKTLEKAGSIAEASLMLSGVMKSAQEAADLYLENIKMLEAEKSALSEKIEYDARAKAEAIISEAERKCAAIEREMYGAANRLRDNSEELITMMANIHKRLHELIEEIDIFRQLPVIEEPVHKGQARIPLDQ